MFVLCDTGDGLRAQRLTVAEYAEGILQGDRVALARAVTVVESDLAADAEIADGILERVLPFSGRARRVGITGVPGAGKSTFIEVLGLHLTRERDEKVAVLTVDPSSPVSGGSILGDKTRMPELAAEDKAFVRPSPSRGRLGGVARRTRETMLLCEAAGYHNVLVETVGVGQSETAVRSMTDFFLLIALAGAGDELQGIKRGILEMIDLLAINKADGDNEARAERTRMEYENALHLFAAMPGDWSPRVIAMSCVTGKNVKELWELVLSHRAIQEASGFLEKRRKEQMRDWMHEAVVSGLEDLLLQDPVIAHKLQEMEAAVDDGAFTPSAAARQIIAAVKKRGG